ncbi:hypothetical protein EV196_11312 [Mariniflexile fucanivorans]|uniref:Uncharacterized protein n=1 Tax=Mariniflexile fucanivorans TaxID=264023 RepID=A0A4R1R9S2_9FLAO|nr:hypothetical protein [Mariniflexile fucanivorans]TCL62471.1 hypothetical protein EV196_11312 [Mariniflexile fucanivorans]
MAKKDGGLLKNSRKKLKIKTKELDSFLNAKTTSTKYYLEESFSENKIFKYLLLLKLKGESLDRLFEDYIKENNIKHGKNE